MARESDFVDDLRACALVVGAKLAATSAVLHAGFVALSDDDYARVVIAQQFSLTPRWDPSGTSWLPFPFWLHGAVLGLFSPSFELARGVSIVASVAALLLLYFVARKVGMKPSEAAVGVTLAGLLPYSLLLGAATPPDGFCAALIAAGILSLRSDQPQALLAGSAGVCVATLSRYESWPVAFVFSAMMLWRVVRKRHLHELAPFAIASFGPLVWMLHGVLHHGSALFFVTRVSAYQHALRASPATGWEDWLRTPLALLRFEPEVVLLLLATLALARAHRSVVPKRNHQAIGESHHAISEHHHAAADAMRTPKIDGDSSLFCGGSILATGALIVFLMVGDIRSSTATHHAERTLLSVWMLAALGLTHELWRLWPKLQLRSWTLLAAALLLGLLARREGPGFGALAARTEERDIGTRARYLLPAGQPLALWTQDYGYFAIQAAFARPGTSQIVDSHDPRTPHAKAPISSAKFGIFDRSLLPPASQVECVAEVLSSNPKFILGRLQPRPRCWP